MDILLFASGNLLATAAAACDDPQTATARQEQCQLYISFTVPCKKRMDLTLTQHQHCVLKNIRYPSG